MAEALPPRFPRVADDLRDMAADLLAFLHFPPAHWRQICATNPLERSNRAMGRRADVVRIFPNRAASLRLLGAAEVQDQVGTDRYERTARPIATGTGRPG